MYETITRYHKLGNLEFILVPIGPFKISGKFLLNKTKNDPEKQLEDSEGYRQGETNPLSSTALDTCGSYRKYGMDNFSFSFLKGNKI